MIQNSFFDKINNQVLVKVKYNSDVSYQYHVIEVHTHIKVSRMFHEKWFPLPIFYLLPYDSP